MPVFSNFHRHSSQFSGMEAQAANRPVPPGVIQAAAAARTLSSAATAQINCAQITCALYTVA